MTWIAIFILLALMALGLFVFVGTLDAHEQERQRWSSSVPTITHLPRREAP